MNRRKFLGLSATAGASAILPRTSFASEASMPGRVRFVFFTDTHIEPELKADEGTAMAMRKIKSMKPDFCIQGGDHCFDLGAVPWERSVMLLDMYAKTSHQLDGIPVHHALGNHDVFGRDPVSGVAPSDPLYGKKMFEQRFEKKTYYSFDEKGYHFIVLDSIGLPADHDWEGHVDAEQLVWLAADLKALRPGTPVVVTTHIPLVSAISQYSTEMKPDGKKHSYFVVDNSQEVLDLFEGHNVIAVLQGHTHVNEVVYWRNTPYITSGAVSGNWWKGARWGTPEGFTVMELADGRAHWHYETYGWKSVAPATDHWRPILQPKTGQAM